jgi:ribosomal protein S16
LEVPQKANVNFVGKYSPSAFAFHTNEYWKEKGLKVSDHVSQISKSD